MFSIAIPTEKFHTRNSVRADEIAVERFAEREKFGRDEPARDAELSDPAFAYFDYGAVELTERERNYGVYVLGKTGSGKTVALTNLALLDIYAGQSTHLFRSARRRRAQPHRPHPDAGAQRKSATSISRA